MTEDTTQKNSVNPDRTGEGQGLSHGRGTLAAVGAEAKREWNINTGRQGRDGSNCHQNATKDENP